VGVRGKGVLRVDRATDYDLARGKGRRLCEGSGLLRHGLTRESFHFHLPSEMLLGLLWTGETTTIAS